MDKPIFVGMNNPQGNYPLYPDPPNCAGWRLWKLLERETGASKKDYLRTFDRMNLVDTPVWDEVAAQDRLPEIMGVLRGRKAVILGTTVARITGVLSGRDRLFCWKKGHHFDYALFPHPSGRNRLFNDPAVVLSASLFLAELYEKTRSS